MEMVVQAIVIASFIGSIIGWGLKQGVIKPLADNINNLQKAITKFEKGVDILERNQHDIDKRVIIVEQSAKSAHHRLDLLEKELMR